MESHHSESWDQELNVLLRLVSIMCRYDYVCQESVCADVDGIRRARPSDCPCGDRPEDEFVADGYVGAVCPAVHECGGRAGGQGGDGMDIRINQWDKRGQPAG